MNQTTDQPKSETMYQNPDMQESPTIHVLLSQAYEIERVSPC